MAALREVREMLLLSLCEGLIDEIEFQLLYDLNVSTNPDFPYWNYEPFFLSSMSDAEYLAEFRFFKNDILRLAQVLNIPIDVV